MCAGCRANLDRSPPFVLAAAEVLQLDPDLHAFAVLASVPRSCSSITIKITSYFDYHYYLLHLASFPRYLSPQSHHLLIISTILPPYIGARDAFLGWSPISVTHIPKNGRSKDADFWSMIRLRPLDPVREACADWISPRDVSLQQAENGGSRVTTIWCTHKATFSVRLRPDIHRVTCVWVCL